MCRRVKPHPTPALALTMMMSPNCHRLRWSRRSHQSSRAGRCDRKCRPDRHLIRCPVPKQTPSRKTCSECRRRNLPGCNGSARPKHAKAVPARPVVCSPRRQRRGCTAVESVSSSTADKPAASHPLPGQTETIARAENTVHGAARLTMQSAAPITASATAARAGQLERHAENAHTHRGRRRDCRSTTRQSGGPYSSNSWSRRQRTTSRSSSPASLRRTPWAGAPQTGDMPLRLALSASGVGRTWAWMRSRSTAKSADARAT